MKKRKERETYEADEWVGGYMTVMILLMIIKLILLIK